MALAQIKELVMILLEPVFVSKDLKEFLEYAKVKCKCILYIKEDIVLYYISYLIL